MKLSDIKNKVIRYPQIIIFSFISLVTIFIGITKITSSPTQEVYVKMKVAQGLWWATTENPSFWLVNNIKKGDKEANLLKNSIAEVVEVRRYPEELNGLNRPTDKFNTYLIVKLLANKGRDGQLSFKRSQIIAGSPIELELTSINISGIIMEVSSDPFSNDYEELEVTLNYQAGYSADYPYLYDNIQVGDVYHNGEEVIFEILDKKLGKIYLDIRNDYGQTYKKPSNVYSNIILTTKIKARKVNNSYVFGEEKYLSIDSPISIITPRYNLQHFIVVNISPYDPDSSAPTSN